MHNINFVLDENPLEFMLLNQFDGTLWVKKSQRWKEFHTFLIDEVLWRKLTFIRPKTLFISTSMVFFYLGERTKREEGG